MLAEGTTLVSWVASSLPPVVVTRLPWRLIWPALRYTSEEWVTWLLKLCQAVQVLVELSSEEEAAETQVGAEPVPLDCRM